MADTGQNSFPLELRLGFMGRYEVAVDKAGRVAIPTKFRELLVRNYGDDGTHVVLAPIGPRIKVFPVPVWLEKVEPAISSQSSMDPLVDRVIHLFYHKSVVVPLDSQSRVRIPSDMRADLEIANKVFVTGQRDYMEIWPPEKWIEADRKFAADYEKILSDLFGKGPGRPGD